MDQNERDLLMTLQQMCISLAQAEVQLWIVLKSHDQLQAEVALVQSAEGTTDDSSIERLVSEQTEAGHESLVLGSIPISRLQVLDHRLRNHSSMVQSLGEVLEKLRQSAGRMMRLLVAAQGNDILDVDPGKWMSIRTTEPGFFERAFDYFLGRHRQTLPDHGHVEAAMREVHLRECRRSIEELTKTLLRLQSSSSVQLESAAQDSSALEADHHSGQRLAAPSCEPEEGASARRTEELRNLSKAVREGKAKLAHLDKIQARIRLAFSLEDAWAGLTGQSSLERSRA